MKAFFDDLARSEFGGILVRDPAGVDGVHVDTVVVVIGRGGTGHHVQRGLRHIGVRMPRGLELAVELAFDRRHVDDVFVAARRLALAGAQHQRLEARVDDERCDGVDQLHFQQFDGRHFGHQQAP